MISVVLFTLASHIHSMAPPSRNLRPPEGMEEGTIFSIIHNRCGEKASGAETQRKARYIESSS